MLSLLFGAGFSKWAVNLPLGKELFDFKIIPWKTEQKKLEKVKLLKKAWDDSYPRGLTEQSISHSLTLEEADRRAVLWYVVRRLSVPFVWEEYHSGRMRRHILMIDEHRRYDIDGVKKAASLLTTCMSIPLSGIITTNYDLLIEYGLGTNGFNYGVQNQQLLGRGPYPVYVWNRGPVTLKGNIRLAKIHGSINNFVYTDGREGLTGEALIVPPVPEKKSPQALKFQWTLAKKILNDSDRLLVFGFGFNPYDRAILKLLRKNNKNIKSVLLVSLSDKAKIGKEIWPGAEIINSRPPLLDENKITDWILKDRTKMDFHF